MIDKIIYIFLGVILFLLGVQISMSDSYKDILFRYHYSFGPQHFIGGIIISSIGIVILLITLLRTKTKNKKKVFVHLFFKGEVFFLLTKPLMVEPLSIS